MNRIEIGQEHVPEEDGICVYAIIMGERVPLMTFRPVTQLIPQTLKSRADLFQQGAEALATGLELSFSGLDPERVGELAREAAREAGVDESTIAMGGVAVGPFGAKEIPGSMTGEECE